MGFLSEIKKLLFVKQSVAKSAAEKTTEFVGDKGSEMLSKSKDILSDGVEMVGDKTSGLRDSILDKGGDVFDTVKDTAGNMVDTIKDNEFVQDATEKVGSFTESVGSVVMDKGGDALDKGKVVAEDLGSKVLDVKDTVVEKAMDVKDKLGDKFDETLAKAEKFEAEEAAKPKREFGETTIDTGGSLLEGTDDFFSKADRFADGDYGAVSEGKTKILEERLDITPKDPGKAAGFIDLDGDGDEIVDDAIIIDDDPEK